ncbi:inositol-tetrakisphosphate 1-kinase-like isoform X1 [Gigantopelta aegis]|uniref:inositol-tetrakisphosphate 1-kinase-like isoform X1 n=1 Tax=Gigantopelta aegis TaxID=1735272 RepID=UPI001B88B9AC|nr:inositol-tetrakisphosphate 1-kinase-like isoform X1 [Gigantopelta aegis]
MTAPPTMKRIGYWISEKKSKKLNFEEHRNMFRNAGIDLKKIDLTRSLEEQGPFDAILNKLADVLTRANMGNTEAQQNIQNIQNYISAHPECIVIDPLPVVRRLLNRYNQYNLMFQSHLVKEESDFFVPPFVELHTTDVETNKKKMAEAGVTFPFVSKTSVAHGSELSHKMAVIFNEEGLKDITVPCVAQSFINHNAVLFKIYVIGTKQFIAQRPSLKNFYSTDHETIFFDSHDVSKPSSSHFLNKMDLPNNLPSGQAKSKPQLLEMVDTESCWKEKVWDVLMDGIKLTDMGCYEKNLEKMALKARKLDAVDLANSPVKPNIVRLKEMGVTLRKVLEMDLFGVDIIIDSETRRHAIIDVNVFPGYDEVDDFFQVLLDHMLQVFHECDAKGRQTEDTNKLLATNTTRIERLDNSTTKNVFQNTCTPSCKRFKSDLCQFKHSFNINGESSMHNNELECQNGIQQFSNSFLVNNSKDHHPSSCCCIKKTDDAAKELASNGH